MSVCAYLYELSYASGVARCDAWQTNDQKNGGSYVWLLRLIETCQTKMFESLTILEELYLEQDPLGQYRLSCTFLNPLLCVSACI